MTHRKNRACVLFCFLGLFANETAIAALNKTVEVGVINIEPITPAGDPVNSPADAGEGQNEFTFSSSSPGILTMTLKAKVLPPGVANEIKDNVIFKVDAVGNSAMSWDIANPNGKPTVAGDFLTAKVLFTGLPNSNAAFGAKKFQILLNGAKIAEQNYEVYFPKTATNNPGSEGFPNWFYYWKEGAVCGIPATSIYEADDSWGYCIPDSDQIIRLCTLAPEENSGPETYTDDSGKTITVAGTGKGIQCVAETVEHESHHLQQYNDTKGKTDSDTDDVANINEPNYDGMATKIYNPDTYNMGGDYESYGDNEIRCRLVETRSTVGYYPAKDWSNPGCHSKNQFGPHP